jgi:hypothetical protein
MVQLEFDFNERKKTAVEWFNQQLVDRQNGKGDSRSLDEILEQANQMFQEQIMKAYDDGAIDTMQEQEGLDISMDQNGEESGKYYNETYGK